MGVDPPRCGGVGWGIASSWFAFSFRYGRLRKSSKAHFSRVLTIRSVRHGGGWILIKWVLRAVCGAINSTYIGV